MDRRPPGAEISNRPLMSVPPLQCSKRPVHDNGEKEIQDYLLTYLPHLFADDTQIYGFCSPDATSQLQNRLSVCINDVADWMRSNRLQLNTAKTEVIWCSSSRRQHQIPPAPVMVGADAIKPSRNVRNQGIYIDCPRGHTWRGLCRLVSQRQIESIRRSVIRRLC